MVNPCGGGGRLRARTQTGPFCKRLMIVLATVAVGGGLLVACGGSTSSTSSADQLLARNPAALLGGRTIVGTANGQRLTVGSGNDTIAAYGPNETIVGGTGVDQMGAFASHVTIIGGTRSDVIYAGPNATIVSGTAPDLLIDTHNHGTVRLTGDNDEVMVTGQNDQVICAPTSHNDVIYSNQSDSVDPTCSANDASLYDFEQSSPKPGFRLVDTTTASMQGSGTNDDPYVAPCANPSAEDCTVTFDYRWLAGGWANGSVETIPAYRCPTDHPYLVAQKLVPFGTTAPFGVQIEQTSNPWAINVYIGQFSTTGQGVKGNRLATGIVSSWHESGATNWTAFRNAYRIVLHCTSNADHSYRG
jgi:hypothetical protein